MNTQAAEYFRAEGFVVLQSEAAQVEFEDTINAYFSGRLTGAEVRASLFRLNLSVEQIRRVLKGVRPVSVSA